MPTRLTALSAATVGAAIEENLVELLTAFGRLPQAQFEATPALTRLSTPMLSPMFNGVAQTRLTEDDLDASIERTLRHFAEQRIPRMFWWLDGQTQPAGLGARLEAHGLLPYEIDAPGMAVDLLALNEADGLPPGLTISLVRDAADLDAWAHAFIAGMGMPPFGGLSWLQATTQLGLAAAPWRLALGRLHGRPVAVAMLFPGTSVAGIYAVATVPEARGRGIGGAMTLALLREARGLGYRAAVLWASVMGRRVYERLGFRTYSTISRYLWQATD